MSFAPGQFITAQRLNRLQTKSYFSMASATVSSGTSVPGSAISITVETNGATAACSWTAAVYATAANMAANTNARAKYDLASAPTYALAQWSGASEKGTVANFWSTTVSTAGTYTFQLECGLNTATLSIYTSLMVQIMEVA